MTSLTERQGHILQALVEHHTESGEPVSSKRLVGTYGLDVSPATVRTAMAQLEEDGYLEQPHTSSGRIPTERAYRFYVDRLLDRDDPNSKARGPRDPAAAIRVRMMRQFQAIAVEDREALLHATCHLLAQLSQYIGVVVGGTVQDSRLLRLELVAVGTSQILAVLVLDTGTVRQRTLSRPQDCDTEDMRAIGSLLNQRLAGKTLREIQSFATHINALTQILDGRHRDTAVSIARDAFSRTYGSEIYWDGVRNLPIHGDISDIARTAAFLRTLESKDSLVAVVDDGASPSGTGDRVRVRIGSELSGDGLDEVSVVTAHYPISSHVVGVLGVIGPMRMRYPRVIPLVHMAARLMARQFAGMGT